MVQYLVNFLNSLQGMRKTIVMFSLIVITSVFRVKGYLSGDNMSDLLKSTVIAYFGSNSVEHFTTMVKEHLTSKNVAKTVTEIDSTTTDG
jgi:hypothetical protein